MPITGNYQIFAVSIAFYTYIYILNLYANGIMRLCPCVFVCVWVCRYKFISVKLLMSCGNMYILHQTLAPILLQIKWLEIFQLIIRFIAIYNRCSLLADLRKIRNNILLKWRPPTHTYICIYWCTYINKHYKRPATRCSTLWINSVASPICIYPILTLFHASRM